MIGLKNVETRGATSLDGLKKIKNKLSTLVMIVQQRSKHLFAVPDCIALLYKLSVLLKQKKSTSTQKDNSSLSILLRIF